MTEIDFDELDKAVNSLMDTANKPQSQEDTDTGGVSTENAGNQSMPSEQPEDKPSNIADPVAEDAQALDAHKPTAILQTPLANRRRGQFMDMKHSSSDMRTVPSTVKPSSRVGVTLSPISDTVIPGPQASSPVSSPVTVPESGSTAGEVVQASDDVEALLPSSFESSDSEYRDAPEATDGNDQSGAGQEPDAEVSPEPTSPFLPNAKVEKRPLGAPMPAADIPAQTDEAVDGISDVSMKHDLDLEVPTPESVAPATISTTLPKELHQSVLEVEADTTATGDVQQDNGSEQAAVANDKSGVVLGESQSTTISDAKNSDNQSNIPASIPPQYTAKKTTDSVTADEPQASMYDSAVNHPALVQPKKSSHWAIVIAIVGMILLGALGGAVLYLFQTGAL